MAISGTWKARQTAGYSGALRQGTGWNPVHGVRGNEGRNLTPDGVTDIVPEIVVDANDADNYGFQTEDQASVLWGYGPETGTSDRPALDSTYDRDSTGGYPSPGKYRSGIPGGSVIRAQDHGAEAGYTAKATQPDAAQGHFAKVDTFGEIEDALPSDDSQVFMQTSMTQMPKDREGSQRGAGSQSDFAAPVPGRRPTMGQRRYVASDGTRHEEMQPKQQDLILRPFRFRQAGTGNPEWMQANETSLNEPLQRTPTADPYPGVQVPSGEVPGFVDEGWQSYV